MDGARGDSAANEERLRAAVGPRADYYLKHWAAMDASGKKSDWNWAACFANLYWLAFRKMWLALVLFILANIVVSLPGALVPALNKYTIVLMIGLTFVTGSYGNLFYRRQTEKLVASDAPIEQLRRRGGTSPLALIVALGLSVGLGALSIGPALKQIQAERAARLHSP
ncbi:MAG: DUF2628 domain-containing protein [Sphingomonadaceae bacterium]|nr:DUF2628 domain-containing protein [Sphingomonadaceae bacterium]